MADEKIFQEIKGVFSWIEEKKKHEKKTNISNEKLRPEEKTYNQLKDFLGFLNVEATHVRLILNDKEGPLLNKN